MALLVVVSACTGAAEGGSTTTTPMPTSTTSTTSTTTTSTTSTTTTTLAPTTTAAPAPTTTVSATTTSQAPTTTATAAPLPPFDSSIANVTAARLAHSYTTDCPVTPEQVVMVTVDHWGFDGKVHTGRIVVARSQGASTAEVFRRLYQIEYPIQSMIPIGDLPEGIEDSDPNYNNTSGLHCRRATGSTRWSEHASGLAIDINPFLNPFITSNTLWPTNSGRYRDRTLGEQGMIVGGDAVVDAFRDNGWHWGGYWSSIKDYHHFSVNNR